MSVLNELNVSEKRMIKKAIRKKTTSMVVIDSATVDGEVFGYASYICSNTDGMMMLPGSDNEKPGIVTFINTKVLESVPQGKRERVYFFKNKMEVTCYDEDRA